jgi:nucleoside-diphosphate-sugar epimerase
MRVFVAGATGAVGRPLVSQLVAAGHQVTATTRSESKFGELAALGAQPVAMDGLDAAAVGEAVAAAEPDAIIHQMTALAGRAGLKHFDRSFAITNQLRTIGTDNLLAAARAAGVARFVAQSFTGWPNARIGGPVKTETDPLDPIPPKNQRASLTAIRHTEQAVTEAPLEGVVLRYGLLYGPGAAQDWFELIHKRRMPVVGDGAGIWSMLHVVDAASAAVAALERGSGIYNIADDDPAPTADVLTTIAEIIGAKPPRHVPVWLARMAAGDVGVSMMTSVRGSSNARAKAELDWTPRWPSWRDGFRYGMATIAPAPTG